MDSVILERGVYKTIVSEFRMTGGLGSWVAWDESGSAETPRLVEIVMGSDGQLRTTAGRPVAPSPKPTLLHHCLVHKLGPPIARTQYLDLFAHSRSGKIVVYMYEFDQIKIIAANQIIEFFSKYHQYARTKFDDADQFMREFFTTADKN
jgi:hypothetical protein